MQPPKLIAIAAMASNRVIGHQGKLPWHLPEDLKFFKARTFGHPVLMGRKTFESIMQQLGKPLPGRTSIVLSKTMEPPPGVHVIRNLGELSNVLEKVQSDSPAASGGQTVFLIGGAQLYQTLLPSCDELLLTWISEPYVGDTFFPEYEKHFRLTELLGHGLGFEFRRYVKI